MSAATAEADLVAAAKAGSSRAYEQLVARHQQAVRGFLRRLCGDWPDADDLAQDTFIAGWRDLGRFAGASSLRTWLCAIAYRKALTHRRGVRRGQVRDAAYARARPETAEDADAAEHIRLRQAMMQLSVEQRAAISLCLAAAFSHSEAAEVLGLPLGTLKSHLSRGRERLLQILGGDHGRG